MQVNHFIALFTCYVNSKMEGDERLTYHCFRIEEVEVIPYGGGVENGGREKHQKLSWSVVNVATSSMLPVLKN